MKYIVLLFCLFLQIATCFSQDKLEVFFDFNKSDLNPIALKSLENQILTQADTKIVKIHGFCDWKGTNQYNDTLSLQRVQTVFNYLKEQNVQFDESYLGKGFGENFAQNKIQASNRKVEIFFTNLTSEVKQKMVKPIKEITLSDQIKQGKKGDNIQLKNINFLNNSAQIVPSSYRILYDLLSIMKENPNLKIEIQGHICCQTPNGRDNNVSSARAKAIYDYLVENKIQKVRLTHKGYGVSKPLYPIPEKNEFEENANRRVEIKIIEN
jgi:outer membrane protein OmpA-like peptidoglycan-associated protein